MRAIETFLQRRGTAGNRNRGRVAGLAGVAWQAPPPGTKFHSTLGPTEVVNVETVVRMLVGRIYDATGQGGTTIEAVRGELVENDGFDGVRLGKLKPALYDSR